MKITMYELLGLVKNGRLMPKKIKFENYIYIWRDTQKDYFCEQINHSLESIIGEYLFNNLNLEVEILEEEKKIPTLNDIRESYGLPRIEEKKIPEKLKLYAPYPECDDTRFEDVENKINEIIDYLKSEGE